MTSSEAKFAAPAVWNSLPRTVQFRGCKFFWVGIPPAPKKKPGINTALKCESAPRTPGVMVPRTQRELTGCRSSRPEVETWRIFSIPDAKMNGKHFKHFFLN